MARTGGDKTKKKILSVAEKLFSERGFDGTSVDEIAKTAGVNKALIYYHFKDKNDLITSLFGNILEVLAEQVNCTPGPSDPRDEVAHIAGQIKEEILHLAGKRRILSVMLMEALKSRKRDGYLFECAEIVIQDEAGLPAKIDPRTNLRYLVHEFFTAFIPLITFVVFQEKWCEYFRCDADKLLELFVDSFQRSHLASHLSPE